MKGRAYRCPNPRCNAEVFLRSGRRRADHFAHMPGQGKPECEDFHDSNDLSRTPPMPPGPREQKHVDLLHLSLELDTTELKNAPRKWRLRLTVPKAPDTHGQISIELSNKDTRRISLTKLALGPETYTVAPDALEFGANWVSHDVLPEYRDAVQSRIAGLDPQMGNAFAASRSKLKPRTYSLFWGESYYLVWRQDLAINLPLPLAALPLARVESWNCVMAALPLDPDPEIETWLDEHCDLTVARPSRDWAVLYPAPFAFGDEGALYVPPADAIILALRSDDAAPGDLVCFSGQSPVTTKLDGHRHHFVSISGPDRVAERNVHFTWEGAYVATLATRPYTANTLEFGVHVLGDGPNGKTSAMLHAAAGRMLLSEVRMLRLSLTVLRGHPMLRGYLRSRPAGAFEWSEEALAFSSAAGAATHGKLSEDLVLKLNTILQDSSLDIEIDFGPFGSFAAPGREIPVADPQLADVAIPSPLRLKIEWLARASGAYVNQEQRPLAALGDRSLLAHFRHLRVPAKLLAHQRFIATRLHNLGIRGDHE